MRLSIIICTYNRAHIILQCLPTIISEIIKHPFIEVIIVDNNSKDNTNEVISSFLKVTPNIKYIIEEQIGLSYARNRGYKEADSGWVIYIDDDAKIQEGYINRLLLIISNYDFDCFGGMYYSWYLYGKPRWLPENFGNKESLRPDVGLIDGSTGWLSGGNFAIKKAVLKAVGGFNPELGMSGNNIGYGEEDYLQQQLFEEGYKIGFDPNLVIDHLVLPHKLALSWHLNSTLKHKKASVKLKKEKIKISIFILNLIKMIIVIVLKIIPIGVYKVLFYKNYYWQNFILDVFQPLLDQIGLFYYSAKFKTVNWKLW